MKSIELVIFDLDNVLVDHWPERRLRYLSRLSGMSHEAIQATIYDSAFEREAEAGAYATGEEYLREFNQRLGFQLTREQWLQARGELMGPRPRREMLEIARDLRSRVRLALLTNNGPLLRESLPVLAPEVYELFDDACHTSCQFMARKPDPLVFQRLLMHHHVAPEAAVFIDDDLSYVEGAKKVGLTAIHFTGIDELRIELQALRI